MPLVCRDAAEMMTDYTEGRLGVTRWVSLRWHLKICPMCRAFLAQLRATREIVGKTELPADAAGEAQALAQRPPAGATPPATTPEA